MPPNSSGVNTPIPKMQIAYRESTALASLYLGINSLSHWHWCKHADSEYINILIIEQ